MNLHLKMMTITYNTHYYNGTTSHDYKMACFVLGNKSVTIQEMNAVYSREDAENDDLNKDIGSSPIGSTG
jgi:hypothetical protein